MSVKRSVKTMLKQKIDIFDLAKMVINGMPTEYKRKLVGLRIRAEENEIRLDKNKGRVMSACYDRKRNMITVYMYPTLTYDDERMFKLIRHEVNHALGITHKEMRGGE